MDNFILDPVMDSGFFTKNNTVVPTDPAEFPTSGYVKIYYRFGSWYYCDSDGNEHTLGGGGITSLNTLSAANQTFATGVSGTNFNIVSSGSTHTFNIPIANNSNTGLLSNTSFTTFSNKVSSVSAASANIVIAGTSVAPTIDLSNTGVTPNTYTNATIVVDAQGRIISASDGSGGGGLRSRHFVGRGLPPYAGNMGSQVIQNTAEFYAYEEDEGLFFNSGTYGFTSGSTTLTQDASFQDSSNVVIMRYKMTGATGRTNVTASCYGITNKLYKAENFLSTSFRTVSSAFSGAISNKLMFNKLNFLSKKINGLDDGLISLPSNQTFSTTGSNVTLASNSELGVSGDRLLVIGGFTGVNSTLSHDLYALYMGSTMILDGMEATTVSSPNSSFESTMFAKISPVLSIPEATSLQTRKTTAGSITYENCFLYTSIINDGMGFIDEGVLDGFTGASETTLYTGNITLSEDSRMLIWLRMLQRSATAGQGFYLMVYVDGVLVNYIEDTVISTSITTYTYACGMCMTNIYSAGIHTITVVGARRLNENPQYITISAVEIRG